MNSHLVTEHQGHAFISSWEIAKALGVWHEEVVRTIEPVLRMHADSDLLESRDVYYLDEKKNRVHHGYLIKQRLFSLIATDFNIPRERYLKAVKQINAAFDEVESKLKPKNYTEMLKKYVDEVELKESLLELQKDNALLKIQVDTLKPKAKFAEAVIATGRCVQIGELAKMLRNIGTRMSEHRLYECLRQDGYLSAAIGDYNRPTSVAILNDLLKVKEKVVRDAEDEETTRITVLVTTKGQQFFVNKYCDANKQEKLKC